VCADMSCHLNGACELRADIERRFANARRSEVEIRDVSCLGRCDHAPAISVNDHIFTDITGDRAESLVPERRRERRRNSMAISASARNCSSDPYPDTELRCCVPRLPRRIGMDCWHC
jgi:formate dehydrogenase/NADH-quinone oxidoreductase subunit F